MGELSLGQAVEVSDQAIELSAELGSLRRASVTPRWWLLMPTSLARSSNSGVVQISRAARSTNRQRKRDHSQSSRGTGIWLNIKEIQSDS